MIVYRELSSLTQDLQIPAKTLYALINRLDSHYRPQWIPKASGGFRKLWIPDPVLKTIQRRISTVLLAYMPVSPYAAAYRPGCSPRRNGAVHVGKPLVLKVDILHFFDSISYSMVKNRAFPQEVYAEPLRILLTMLCYYKEGLPQGAPSSPVISNIIFYELDQQIGHWCSQRQIQYSRYCDDLTFSGDFSPAQLLAFLEPLLKGQGFLLNGQKPRSSEGDSSSRLPAWWSMRSWGYRPPTAGSCGRSCITVKNMALPATFRESAALQQWRPTAIICWARSTMYSA